MWHRHKGLPEGWTDIVDDHVAVWQLLDDDERAVVAADADWLLRHKHWEAANGFELDDTIIVTVAMQAAVLVLGLDVEELREVSAVVVYPGAMQSAGVRAGAIPGTVSDGPLPILGEAHDRRGPVLIAWDQAHAASRDPGHGHNVTLHEFAHKLDMVDQVIDGMPRLGRRVDHQRWYDVCTEVFTALRAGVDRPPLDPYAATDAAEFFAVATETFFDVPLDLEDREPALYEMLRDYYGQDPAERVRRSR